MSKNPNTNRDEAVEKLLTAAGGKLVAMYGTRGSRCDGDIDVDFAVAPAISGVVASSDSVQNVKMQRQFSGEEVVAIRRKRTELGVLSGVRSILHRRAA